MIFITCNVHSKYNLKALLNEQYNNVDKQELVAVVKKNSQFKDLASLKAKRACLVQNGKSGQLQINKTHF